MVVVTVTFLDANGDTTTHMAGVEKSFSLIIKAAISMKAILWITKYRCFKKTNYTKNKDQMKIISYVLVVHLTYLSKRFGIFIISSTNTQKIMYQEHGNQHFCKYPWVFIILCLLFILWSTGILFSKPEGPLTGHKFPQQSTQHHNPTRQQKTLYYLHKMLKIIIDC